MKGKWYALAAGIMAAACLLGACQAAVVKPQSPAPVYTPLPAVTPTPKANQFDAGNAKAVEKLKKNPQSSKFYPHWETMTLDEVGFDGSIDGVYVKLPQNTDRARLEDVLEKAVLTYFIGSVRDKPVEKCFAGAQVLFPHDNNAPKVLQGGEQIFLVHAAFAAYGFCEGELTARNEYSAQASEAPEVQQTPAPKRKPKPTPEPTPTSEPPAPFPVKAAFVRWIYINTHAIVGIREDNGMYDVTRFIEPVEYGVPLYSPEIAAIFPIEVLADAAGRTPGVRDMLDRALYDDIRSQAEAYVRSLNRNEPVVDEAALNPAPGESVLEKLWVFRPDFNGIGVHGLEAFSPFDGGVYRVKAKAALEAINGGTRVTLMRTWAKPGTEPLESRWTYEYDADSQVFTELDAERNDP